MICSSIPTRRIVIMCTAHYVPTPPPSTTSNALHARWLCVCVCVCVCCVCVCVFGYVSVFVYVCFFGGMIFSTFVDTDFFPNNITSVDFYRFWRAKNSLSLQFLTWRKIISSKTEFLTSPSLMCGNINQCILLIRKPGAIKYRYFLSSFWKTRQLEY